MKIIQAETSDNLTFKGLFSEPKTKSETIILHIHGMSGDIYRNSFYPHMHTSYPENGMAFLAAEHRGTHSINQIPGKDGETINCGNAYEIFEDSQKDIEAWIKAARDLGYSNIWLQSHSLGPSKVTYYMNQDPDKSIQGLIFLSPSDMLGLVNTSDQKDAHVSRLRSANLLKKSGRSQEILEDDLWGEMKLSAETYLNFFGENSNAAIFNYDAPELGWNQVESLRLPVIALTGTQDNGIVPVIDAHEAMRRLEGALKNCPRKKTIVFKESDHDFKGFGAEITKEVVEFMQSE